MDITNLEVECQGRPCISVWAKCHSPEDVDDIIAWLRLAKDMMIKWEKIRAKAPHAAKAPAGKHEAAQPWQVQDKSQESQG